MLCKDAKAKKLAIGLMSGTSADGIDAVLVEISGCSTNTHVRQMAFVTLPFTPMLCAAAFYRWRQGTLAAARNFA